MSHKSPEFDMSSFLGRCRHYNAIAIPVIFFTAPFRMREAKELIKTLDARTDTLSPEDVTAYRQASRIVKSIEHPDTGKPIPFYGRMSGFIPMNLPITFLMIMARPTQLNIVLG